jgi:hypothetical protein
MTVRVARQGVSTKKMLGLRQQGVGERHHCSKAIAERRGGERINIARKAGVKIVCRGVKHFLGSRDRDDQTRHLLLQVASNISKVLM